MGRTVTGAALAVLDGAIDLVIAVLYTTIIAAMFAQVVFRYVLGSPLSWSEEISRYMFVWLCYLGAYVGVVRNAHIGVDYLTRRFSARLQRNLTVVLNGLIVGALGLVAYQGALLTWDNLGAPWWTIAFLSMSLPYLAVPVGALLMIMGFLRLTGQALLGTAPAATRDPREL